MFVDMLFGDKENWASYETFRCSLLSYGIEELWNVFLKLKIIFFNLTALHACNTQRFLYLLSPHRDTFFAHSNTQHLTIKVSMHKNRYCVNQIR